MEREGERPFYCHAYFAARTNMGWPRSHARQSEHSSENVGGICLERANYSFTMSREHLEGGAGADKNHAQVKHVSNNMANIWEVNSACRPCLSGADLLQAIECAHSVICGQCPTPFDRLRDLARGGRGCGIDSIVQPVHLQESTDWRCLENFPLFCFIEVSSTIVNTSDATPRH